MLDPTPRRGPLRVLINPLNRIIKKHSMKREREKARNLRKVPAGCGCGNCERLIIFP